MVWFFEGEKLSMCQIPMIFSHCDLRALHCKFQLSVFPFCFCFEITHWSPIQHLRPSKQFLRHWKMVRKRFCTKLQRKRFAHAQKLELWERGSRIINTHHASVGPYKKQSTDLQCKFQTKERMRKQQRLKFLC